MRPERRHTIVVVERTPAVQELVDHVLQETGHRIFVTKDPLEALELAYRIRIDLLVSDGSVLAESGILGDLRSIQPWLGFHYLEDGRGTEIDPVGTLKSPFSLDELKQAVAASLTGRA